ncbi:MAG: hypothetical protein AB7H90_08280 [Alphaproteobacteria bacterium]
MSPEQAFEAMFVFLDEYYRRTNGTAELGDVLGDIQLVQSDRRPADPAAWTDWLAAIDLIVKEESQHDE